jgi:hypothetical protein
MLAQMAQAMAMMLQQQSTMIALLAQIVTNNEVRTPDRPKTGGNK